MDEKDMKILSIVREDAKMTNRQISKKLLIPLSTVNNRIRNMEKDGVIKKYIAVPDYKKIGFSAVAYVLVSVDYTNFETVEIMKKEFKESIGDNGIIESFDAVTGTTDMVLKIRTRGIEGLDKFLVAANLRKLKYVKDTETMLVLREL
ncbi:MAG: Lrp/AsnC family transcriptional regulator [Nanoarchaeota archaeon]